MHITIQQIEIFLTVANANSISHASEQLYISQPALSGKIKQLEDTLGYKLFDRTNKGVVLTNEGLRLYSSLNPVYHRFRVSVNQIIRSHADKEPNDLNIGCLHMKEAINTMYLVGCAYGERFPQSKLTYEYYNYQELVAKLVCRELDAIFTLSFDAEDNEQLESIRIRPIVSRFVFPASWGIHDLSPENCDKLQGKHPLMEMHRGRDNFFTECRANGFEPGKEIYVSSHLEVLNMVREGEGFSILTDVLPSVAERSLGYTIVDFKPDCGAPKVYFSIAWRPDETRRSVLDLVETASKPEFIHWPSNQSYNPAGPGWWY